MMRVGVDVGGTFTDLVAVRPDGTLEIRKVASTPDDPSVGLLASLDALGEAAIGVLVHGTTVATNALLERRGARVVLLATAGFEDLLWLRRQDRPALYDLARDHPPPLVARDDVLGVRERMGPDGVIEVLSGAEVERVIAEVRERAPESVAIALLFAFRHSSHERILADRLRAALPGVPIVASHEALPVFREYERTSTTTAEAYLRPKVSSYVAKTAAATKRRGVHSLRIMTSSGGTLDPQHAAQRAASLALSGPAGGVVGAGMGHMGSLPQRLLTLDMGGTSADASLIGSDYLLFSGRTTLREGSGAVGGVPLALPALLIETVSAGGGSIASLDDGGALKVGPRSAGAVPGPACYGRGGTEPTVTDACLALGWLDADCPLADSLRLDKAAALRALATLGRGGDPVSTAAGVVEVATAIMARALKRVSVARGIDPRSLALLPFGGAGPLFGCALAESLGMSKVIVPPHPGVLSALGLAVAPERVDVMASFHVRFEDLDREMLARAFEPLVAAAWKELQTMDDAEGGTVSRYVDCRFVGQGHEITVRMMWDDTDLLERMFREMHRERHGHSDPDSAVEVVNLRVVAERYSTEIVPWGRRPTAIPVEPVQRSIVGRDGKRVDAGVYPLDQMPDGQQIDGPAVLAGPDATGLIEAGWRGVVSPSGAVIVERA